MSVIAIDCGASFIKAALFDGGGATVKTIERATPIVNRNELECTDRIDGLISIVEEIFSQLLSNAEDEVRLCISNEMHGFLIARADGSPLTDYISWQKEYGELPLEGGSAFELLSNDRFRQDIERSGMPLRRGLPSVNLLYLKRRGLLDGGAFYTLGDYILRRLSGIKPPIHPTNAAATGLFDLIENNWNQKLSGFVSTDRIKFPKVGTEPIEFRFNGRAILALPALGDQQAALFGAELDREDQLSFNLGTGGQVSRLASTLEFSDRYQTRPFLDGRYLKTIPHIPCGRALNVYFRFVRDVLEQFDRRPGDSEIWARLLQAAAKVEGSELDCDLSFFDNASSSRRVGSIGNIGEYSLTLGKLMRSVFDRTADNFLDAASVLSVEPIKKIIFSGGISRRIDAIRKRISDRFRPIECAISSGDTLNGLYLYVKLSKGGGI